MTRYNITGIIIVLLLMFSCGTYTPGYGIQSGNSGSRNNGLPANPDPNKCYVRTVTLDEYESYEEEFLTYTEEEAEMYPHQRVLVTVREAFSQWETTTYEGCESNDPNDCQVLCYRTYPAEEEVIYVPKDTTLGNPFLQMIEINTLVEKGGLSSYEEIDCELMNYQLLPVAFDYGQATIVPASFKEINERLLRLLDDRPNFRVQINVHTDSRGSAGGNQALSEERAAAIAAYLVSQGIVRSRLVAKGFGETQLLNRCADGVNCSDAEHAENERTEFRVLSAEN